MTPVPVVTAVTDGVWEAALVAALDRGDLGLRVVRRCVDVTDLLAVAATGTASAVLLSADLRRLDRETLARLAAAGVAVVGLARPGDGDGGARLRRLGVRSVLTTDASPEEVSATVVAELAEDLDAAGFDVADPLAALPLQPPGPDTRPPAAVVGDGPGSGRVIAVWGPTGAPGRTTVAVGLAGELAGRGIETLLVDADVYGGVIAQLLGLLDEAPGLAAAARAASAGSLDPSSLAALARRVGPGLRVLTGISRADRWPELRPAAVETVLGRARELATVTIVDCGFCLEQDEELAYDTAAPRRNGATLAILAAADTVLAIGSADPVGVHRLVRGTAALGEVLPDLSPTVVMNRVRRGAVDGDPREQVGAALDRFAGLSPAGYIPFDPAAVDMAVRTGRTLVEAAPRSPARLAIGALAAALVGAPVPPPRRRLGSRRTG